MTHHTTTWGARMAARLIELDGRENGFAFRGVKINLGETFGQKLTAFLEASPVFQKGWSEKELLEIIPYALRNGATRISKAHRGAGGISLTIHTHAPVWGRILTLGMWKEMRATVAIPMAGFSASLNLPD